MIRFVIFRTFIGRSDLQLLFAAMANMLILFYMFCGGNMKDNLVGIFNLFDADGNKVITLNELYEIMAVFIEIGEGKDHKVNSRLKWNLLQKQT